MLNSNLLNKAFRSRDVAQVVAALGNNSLADGSIAHKFVEALRQSSCLVVQNEHAATEHRRDLLVVKCRELLGQCPEATVKQNFERHVEDAKIAEFGYRELFRNIHNSDIWHKTPAEQAWGILLRAEREFAYVQSAIAKELDKLATEKHPSLDARQLKIPAEDGSSIRPDSVVGGLVRNLGDTLVMLAYTHKWFDAGTGAIVIPAEVKVDDEIAFKAGNFSLAASQWRCLEHAWDRSRLYGANFRIREQEFPIKEGGARVCKVLEVSAAEGAELMDRIALHRLEQIFFQSQKDLEWKDWSKTSASVATGPIPLAKAGYLCGAEHVASDVLDGNFHLPVDDPSMVIAELPFKAWIRGYAHYAQLAYDSNGNPIFNCLRFSEAEILNGFKQAGLTHDQAEKFLHLTTFGQGVADFFDAPLLKVADGSYRFFAPAYHAPVLGVIVLSRISWLNRRRDAQGQPANDSVFENKGRMFEERVVRSFSDAGIPSRGFKYKLGNTDYDCDAAVVIDDTLFVFECKNRSLPMGHLPSLYYFMLALNDACDQVKRIVKDFTDHPELVTAQFGANTSWNRIVPVVLHAMPWSFGPIDGVYVYDGSALAHLIHEGFTSIVAEFGIGAHRMLRRHRYPLRKGNTPTAAELEKEMQNPNQLRLHGLGWTQQSRPIQISENVVFALPEWSQHSATLEEQMIALGSSAAEAAKMAKEMNETVPDAIDKIRTNILRGQGRTKVGRNDPCPCGSGKKFKKCCLS